jgi:hypothetical protein
MAPYPWSVLGISKTTEERAVRTAYASKLKVTRPEDDPDAFQKLVEARDAAMRVVHQHAEKKSTSKNTIVKVVAEERPKVRVEAKPEQELGRKQVKVAGPIAAAETSNTDNIVKEIVQFLGDAADRSNFEKVENALSFLGELPIEEKDGAEFTFLIASQCFLSPNVKRPKIAANNDTALHDFQKYVVLRLADEYDWTQNDRRIGYMLSLGHEDFCDKLQILKSVERILKSFERPKNLPRNLLTKWQRRIGYLVLGIIVINLVKPIIRWLTQ